MKKLLTLILASSAVVAMADNNDLYVGVGAGAGWSNQASPATTFRLDGGYNFNQYWALELGTTGLTQSGGGTNQNVQYYDLSVKGTLPLGSPAVDLFAQFGGAYGVPGQIATTNPGNTSGAYQSSWGFMSGVGVDLNISQHFSLNLSDLYYYGPSAGLQGNTNVLLLGAKYQM